jgi:quinoprotein glucose dehydrogenase
MWGRKQAQTGKVMRRTKTTLFGICVLYLVGCVGAFAQDETPDPKVPLVESASKEGVEAIEGFKFPGKLKCSQFAAEPDVANIVAFHRDYQGRMFVCETFRQEKGVEDNRRHAHWMDEELAAQTVQDRIDYIRKYIPDADTAYTENDDRIRLIEDTDGDGKADSSKVFSDKYNKLEMGTGAGVLSYRDKVYYTCIPDLFELQDKDGDGVAEVRKSLHTGYGVRFAFRGHDMHGLIVGPDGRLYFSIGDRGYNISPDIKDPASGAVFRCELDGSNLEVVCTGLRNPQELAFDDYGNLFTCDNNSDSGDKARWTELVKGGDSGWRMYYQYLEDRGPFNQEKIWHPWHNESPAYIIPPVKNISDGPSGLEYYPGTGFGENFNGRFFLCDFRGDASRSGVRSFRSVQDGAFWKIEDEDQPLWNMLVTDIDFGSDGKLYASDWVFGWNGVNKGRLYAFEDPEIQQTSIVKEVERLLKRGFKQHLPGDLEGLLSHVDQRIRQESQFELVSRGEYSTLRKVAEDKNTNQLGRIHALWGIGQLGRLAKSKNLRFDQSFIGKLLADDDAQVLCAAAGVAGDVGADPALLAKLLSHENLRVRYAAGMALSKIGSNGELVSVKKMLDENANQDPMVRHAGIMALQGIFQRDNAPATGAVAKLVTDSPEIQIALVVAMRKSLQSNLNNKFGHREAAINVLKELLAVEDVSVVLEAARAVHDLPVLEAMDSLAELGENIDNFAESDPLVRRIINANFRLGTQANAKRLSEIALNKKVSADRRVGAVNALADWANPSSNDRLLHDWRPLDASKRNVVDARDSLGSRFADVMVDEAISNDAILAAGKLDIVGIGDSLSTVIWQTDKDATIRSSALSSYSKLGDVSLNDRDAMVEQLIENFGSLPDSMAGVAIGMIAAKDGKIGLGLIEDEIKSGKQQTQQMALATLGKMKSPESAKYLASLLETMNANSEAMQNLRLDVLMAAEVRVEEEVRLEREKYEEKIASQKTRSAPYMDSLKGGNHEAGSKVFYGKTEVSCVRCHRIDGTGGRVGPELSGIGLTKDRKYLMEAVADPNKIIAEGYTQVKVLTLDGKLHTGIIKSESDDVMVLMDADGKEIYLNQDDIEDVAQGKSSMPDDLIKQLSKQEVRDLVEFLSHRKTKPKKDAGHE